MKKFLAGMALLVLVVGSIQAQGLVGFSSSTQSTSTNSIAGGAAAGKISGGAGQYYFALYYSTTATSVNGQTGPISGSANNSYAFNDSAWKLAGYATNTSTAGRFLGSANLVIPDVPGGANARFVIIGWSANMGTTIAALQASGMNNGYIGQSAVSGSIMLGDGGVIPTQNVMGGSSPLIQGFLLGAVSLDYFIPPFMNTQPTNQTVMLGDTVTFTAVAEGHFALELTAQWKLNGTNIPAGGNYVTTSTNVSQYSSDFRTGIFTLTVTNAQMTNAGNYSVLISNAQGSNLSSTALLTIQSGTGTPPGILSQPASLAVPAGSNATFTVSASGTPPLNYQWSLNGTNLAGGTNTSLTLIGVQPVDAGNYAVNVSNAYGSTNSAAAVLTVQVFPPSITSQPSDVYVQAGNTAVFTVAASGTAPLTYQWSYTGTNLVGATNASLAILNVQSVNEGNYVVTIANPYGTTNSHAAHLAILNSASYGFVIFNSGTHRISTNSSAGGSAAGFTATNSGSYYYALYYSPAATSVNGQTSAIAGNATANYAFNDNAWTLAAYGTNTLVAGRFTSMSADGNGNTLISGVAGGTSCQFVVVGWSANIGTNIAAVQTWLNGGAPTTGWIGQSAVSGPLTLGDGGILASPSLFAANAPQLQGFMLGLASTAGATVAPSITSQPANRTAVVGASTSFTFSFVGSPAPTFRWMFNGTNIIGATNSVLTLNNVGYDSAGNYSVTLSNSVGSATSSNAVLTVVSQSGYVIFANTAAPATRIFTNSSIGGVPTGLTGANPGSYCYALFASATATSVNGRTTAILGNSSGNYVFNDAAWTFIGYGTNTLHAGRLISASYDSSGLTPVPGFAGGTTAQFVVIGWSANIGTDLSALQSWFNAGNPTSDGWVGQSAVSGPIQLSDGGIIPPANVFGAAGQALQGFTLGLASPNPLTAYAVAYSPPLIVQSKLVGKNLQLSWPASAGSYSVQSADNPTGPWSDTGLTVSSDGTTSSVTVTTTNQAKYFRLIVQ